MAHLLSRSLDPSKATELVEKGLPWHEVEFLAKELGVTLSAFARLADISEPTFFRRKKLKRFPLQESDHIMRFARLWTLALDVLESEDGARAWLKQPALGLHGRVPLETAKTESGAHEVEALLRRIDYGVLA
jgi:putative toxin-antitoxin system antitoxin component (TIGR02293 family)